MEEEFKLWAGLIVIVIALCSIGMMVSETTKASCRKVAMESRYSASDIQAICK